MLHLFFKLLILSNLTAQSLKNARYSCVKKIELPEEDGKNNDCDQRSETCSGIHNREALAKMQLGRRNCPRACITE